MEKIKIAVSAFLTGIIYYLGGWDVALQALLIFIVIDYITGVALAFYEAKLNSAIGAKGIIKKVGYILIVAVTTTLDKLLGDTGAIRTVVIYFFVANEGLSILENWGAMDLPIPQALLDKLEQLKEKK